MVDNRLHTPDGFSDRLPADLSRKRAVEAAIETVFRSHGFQMVSTPTLEYLEVFEGKGSLRPKETYRFIGRDGEILCLRADMTPAVARLAGTCFPADAFPLKLCYMERQFRNIDSYQGKAREFTQAGVELIGDNTSEADAEVAALAIKCLRAAGLTGFRVDIGHVGFLHGIMEETGCGPEIRHDLMSDILRRDYVSLESRLRQAGIQNPILADLTAWTGGADMLRRALDRTRSPQARRAVEALRDIHQRLSDSGLENCVSYDLSMLGHLDYYTGVIFQGYAPGTGFSVMDGGRYDNLQSQFGQSRPAVGFGIKTDDLLDALANQRALPSLPAGPADALLVYDDVSRKAAMAAADRLRSAGLVIENALTGGDEREAWRRAEQRQVKRLLIYSHNEMYLMDTRGRHLVTIAQIVDQVMVPGTRPSS